MSRTYKFFCKNCKKLIFVKKFKSKYNWNRKKYCSNKCKINFLKDNQVNKNRLKKICVICKKIYFVSKCFKKTSSVCSNKCRYKLISKKLRKYKLIKIKCKQCGLFFEINNKDAKERKFCSLKCFYKSRNKKVEKVCLNCFGKFISKRSFDQKFCCKKCLNEAQSKGIVKCFYKSRSGYRKDISKKLYFKSSLEADYCRYLKFKKIKFKYESKTFRLKINNKIRFYTPDFYLIKKNKFIELKGNFRQNLICVKSLKKNKIKIDIIFFNDFYNFLKKNGLYYKIKNLENKNYENTKNLIYKKNK